MSRRFLRPLRLLPWMLAGGVMGLALFGLALVLGVALRLAIDWLGPVMLIAVLVLIPYLLVRASLRRRP